MKSGGIFEMFDIKQKQSLASFSVLASDAPKKYISLFLILKIQIEFFIAELHVQLEFFQFRLTKKKRKLE